MQRVVQWDAKLYSTNSDFQYKEAHNLLKKYNFLGSELVLDLGCGHGRLTQEIADLVPQGSILGLDNSQEMISYAKEHNIKNNLTFQNKDILDFEFSFQFDVIISTFCLQWITDKRAALKNISKHLKENGHLMLIMPFRNEEIASIRNALIKESYWIEYFHKYVDSTLTLLDNRYDEYAKQAGLKDIEYEITTVPVPFDNLQSLSSFLKVISPYLSSLPNEFLQDLFIEKIVERYVVNHSIHSEEKYEINYDYATLIAKGSVNE